MALRTLSAEQSRTLTDRMLADLARMEAMVTQILESARLERGRVEFKSEPLELGAAVGRGGAHPGGRARPERIPISCDIEAELESTRLNTSPSQNSYSAIS